MLPVIALVGRPNVGKSTLFNYLTRSRDALVADFPGLTRDRQYGRVRRGQRHYLVVDTGGIVRSADGLQDQAMRQVRLAIEEADLILFMVDAREGLNTEDEAVADELRKLAKPVILVMNKTDATDASLAAAEFHALALGDPVAIAASHGSGVDALLELVDARLAPATEIAEPDEEHPGVRIAIVGRPNVGKSTLVNRLLGEVRVVVFDQPGTTRDSIYIPFERDGKAYTLIDTAGIRRRARVSQTIEKFSVIKALQAIERAHVVIFLIDASEGVTDQDANLLGMVLESGRGLIVALNKWDGLSQNQRQLVKRQLDLKLSFLDFAEKQFISALHGTGVGKLLETVDEIYRFSTLVHSTSALTKILQAAVESHQPPLIQGRRIKLKYAHQGGQNPPVIVVHGNQVESIPQDYRRYLVNFFRQALGLTGTPLRIEFKGSENPFRGRRNRLTDRQIRKRRRLMRHVKK
jgi:GTP-binding protein